jgi:hypothetical protein
MTTCELFFNIAMKIYRQVQSWSSPDFGGRKFTVASEESSAEKAASLHAIPAPRLLGGLDCDSVSDFDSPPTFCPITRQINVLGTPI